MQQQLEVLESEGKDDPVMRDIQKILYSTEVNPLPTLFRTKLISSQDGFEVPDAAVDEEETF